MFKSWIFKSNIHFDRQIPNLEVTTPDLGTQMPDLDLKPYNTFLVGTQPPMGRPSQKPEIKQSNELCYDNV